MISATCAFYEGAVFAGSGAGQALTKSDMPYQQSQDEALVKTQNMLILPSERNKAIAEGGDKAIWVSQQVESIGGGSAQNTQDIYALSAEVMAHLAQQAQGDPDKMMAILAKAKEQPNGFADQWTPDQKAKLQSIANRIPASQPVSQGYPVEVVK